MPRTKATQEERREQILEAAFRVAARDRLDGLTVRRVAREAGLSSGLVFFYFKTKEALLLALLDWLLERTIVRRTGTRVLSLPSARERYVERLREAIEGVVRERVQVELFFDYWVMGTRHPEVRAKIRHALDQFREVFRPLAEDLLREEPHIVAAGTPEGLAAVAVSVVEGCTIQAIMDPEGFDVERFMRSLGSLLAAEPATV
ncbi:MAG: TetR family transcriptional regulator [Thermoanaerobaculia bacterium]|nr:TetR family transcriptional regulator [Thermoanaerobaculia bacterium]